MSTAIRRKTKTIRGAEDLFVYLSVSKNVHDLIDDLEWAMNDI
jgi:hypothetical protein